MPASPSPTLLTLIKQGTRLLVQAGVDSPRLSAEVLLSYCLGLESNELRKRLIISPGTPVNHQQREWFEALCTKRAQGEPVAYLTGSKEFFGLDFKVTPATLIPRPDTELLVELAIKTARHIQSGREEGHTHCPPPYQSAPEARLNGSSDCPTIDDSTLVFADLGTGSGCIAISLALQLTDWHGLALDISPQALAVARQNAITHRASNLTFIQASFRALPLTYRSLKLIVSNPPYISSEQYNSLHHEVKSFEPASALVPGSCLSPPPNFFAKAEAMPAHHVNSHVNHHSNGLEDCFAIVNCAEHVLAPGGALLMEIGCDQGQAMLGHCQQRGWQNIAIHKDLAGHDRVVASFWPETVTR